MAGTFPNRQYLHSGDVRRPQGGPDPTAGRHLRGTDDLGPPRPRRTCRRATTTSTCRSSRCGAGAWTATGRRSTTTSTTPRGAPNFVMVDPGFRDSTDDHSGPTSVRHVHPRCSAFAQSPGSGRSCLYDEWVFSTTCVPRRRSSRSRRLRQTGSDRRVADAHVDHTRSDHTSVLRFLEWRFLGAPGTGAGRREPLVAHATRPPRAQPRDRARRGGARIRTSAFDVDLPLVARRTAVRVPAVGHRAAATGQRGRDLERVGGRPGAAGADPAGRAGRLGGALAAALTGRLAATGWPERERVLPH